MSRVFLPSLVVAFAISFGGCSNANDHLDGYSAAEGNLADFIIKSAPKFGVHLLATNGLPTVAAKWHYKTTSETLEVIVDGNCHTQLDSFLTKAIGPVQGQPRSTHGSVEAYYGTNLGATVYCRWDIVDAAKEYTSFVIVGYGQPASDQTKYAQMLGLAAQAVKEGKDSDRALDAARSSAPYVSDFLRLFPQAKVRYMSFAGGLGFDVNADLYERYELTMQLPVVFDPAHSKVVDYGEPRFTICEAARVERNKSGIAETTLNPAGERRFGSTEWKRIVESRGDFSIIGYAMLTNQPVQGFKDRKTAKEP